MRNFRPTEYALFRIGASIATAALVWALGCGATGHMPTAPLTLSFVNSSNPGTSPQPVSVTAFDLNGDGILDLVAPADGGLNVFLGRGDGTFVPAPTISMPQINNVAAADFNGDGIPDLALSLPDVNQVEVLLGNGDGTFSSLSPISSDSVAFVQAPGDLNGDGNADLVVIAPGADAITILLGNGDGTFPTEQMISVSGGPQSLAVGDFDRDGKTDLAVVSVFSQTMTVLMGNGDGTFTAKVQHPATGHIPVSATVGDFNGDGILDLVVANLNSGAPSLGSLTVMLGNGDGTFRPTPSSPVLGSCPGSIASADFNQDGHRDIVATSSYEGTTSVLLGNGDGTFDAPLSFPSGAGSLFAAVGDYNGDGVPDLAVAAGNANRVTVLLAKLTPGVAVRASDVHQ